MMKSIIIFVVLVPISITLTFKVLQKFFPVKNKPPVEKYNPEALKAKFKSLERLFYVLFFLITLVLTLFFTKLMTIVQSYYLDRYTQDALFINSVTRAAFMIPAFFLALLVSGLIADYVLNTLGKRRADNLEEWQVFYFNMNKRHTTGEYEVDTRKTGVLLASFIIPLFIIMFFLGVHNYSLVTSNFLIHNHYFSLKEKKYPYSEILKILYIDKFRNKQTGNIEPTSSYYAILMKDGYRWTTLNLDINKTAEEREVIEYISRQSNVVIQEGVQNLDDKL